MKRIHRVAVLSVVILAGGCKDLQVPDYYAPSISSLEQGATRAQVIVAAVGLLAYSRDIQSAIFSSRSSTLVRRVEKGSTSIRAIRSRCLTSLSGARVAPTGRHGPCSIAAFDRSMSCFGDWRARRA